jgi:hypothetical protein
MRSIAIYLSDDGSKAKGSTARIMLYIMWWPSNVRAVPTYYFIVIWQCNNNNNNNIDLYCINKQRVQSGLQALSLNQDNIQKDY